jgi:CBS domain-containing membrane protein
MSNISTLMTENPVHLDPEARIEDAWKIMHTHRVRHVPVVKGDKLVGLVTQKDLLVNAQNRSLLTLPVAEIMVFRVSTITTDTTAEEAAKVMLNDKISCLPVVEDDKLVGIITETDFLKLLIQLLAESKN